MNNGCLLDHILEQTKKTPDAIAIIHDHVVITYHDLVLHANRLTHYLKEYQIKESSHVVICMRRSFEVFAAILAIWKLDATYLPIDPETPLARIQQILKEAKPGCIVSEPALLSKINHQDIPVLTLKDSAYFYHEQSSESHSINREEGGEQLAYIIYTSGSTGTPKGVMVSQNNLKNHVTWLIENFKFTSKDVFSFNSPLAFDFSVPCTIAPIVIGATVVITSESDTLTPARYFQQLVKNRVTFVKWTPSYFKLLVEYVEKHQPDLSSFRYLMVAGEELLTEYVKRWLKIYPYHHIVNEYGPTETTVGATAHIITQDTLNKNLATVPIGKAVNNTELYVVDPQNYQIEVKKGEVGELLIGGASVACGYYNRLDLTNERFLDHPFSSTKQKLYKTGDLVKELPDGNYLYIGRIDHQVKINGYRIELHEIEQRLLHHASIKQAAVTVDKKDQKNPTLVAYLVLQEKETLDRTKMSNYLSQYLPHYMLPQSYHAISHIPLTINGKRDYSKLTEQILEPHPESKEQTIFSNIFLTSIAQILKKHIHTDEFDLNNSFFSLGISSLLAAQIVTDINQTCHVILKVNDLFLYPSPLALANFLEDQSTDVDNSFNNRDSLNRKQQLHHIPIAIIAMECRYPGADNCEAFWDMCREGKESITFFNTDKSNHSSPNIENYVYARGILNNIEYFDAEFFNFSPKEAHLSDPQHRLFLETAWTALEKAGYAAGSKQLGATGVYASMNESTYIVDHDLAQLAKHNFPDDFSLLRLMSSQFLGTKVAYHLNCTGPAFSMQTACSSSLVSVALACQQLSDYQCDIALAGGVSITTPQDKPYLYQPGNIFSPDGHCRPFDADAKGTVFSNGLGIVVLKRLVDAVGDNDTILAVIKGASINNDGSDKMSYAAPSIKAQAACIASAQTIANVDAESIQYVEAHGTGTLIGDPIEIAALSKAFRKISNQQQFCAIGFLKANIGHTHVAAGVGGLIRTVLALQNCEIPPTINFTQPNPNINFEHSPFYVNTRLQHWPHQQQRPRRAAVSAFGVGGTNAHVILEEAPVPENYPTKRQYHALLLSAKNLSALEEYHEKLISYLEQAESQKNPQILLADIAYTLQVGRLGCEYRSGIVSDSISDAIAQLKEAKNHIHQVDHNPSHSQIVFLFPGQGTQYINLSRELYQEEIIYREHLDHCLEIASTYMKIELKEILFVNLENISSFESKLYETEFAHPILFSIEYALAQLLISFGIKPNAMLGHSLGEYVAACLAGVFTLEDAIKLVCTRGNAIAKCVKGEMLAISLSQEELSPFCDKDISIAAVNAPQLCVVSGTKTSVQALKQKLTSDLSDQSPSIRKIKSHYPFHSPLLNPAIEFLQSALKLIPRKTPTIPYLSNLTGGWVTEENVQGDDYWIEHMLKTVQFSACVQKLIENPNAIFIEVGAGSTLLSLLQQHSNQPLKMLKLLPSAASKNEINSHKQVAEALTQLWKYGCKVQWHQYYQQEKRRRIPLPTYPFQRKRFWFDEIITDKNILFHRVPSPSKPELSFYASAWIRDSEPLQSMVFPTSSDKKRRWIIFDNFSRLSQQAIKDLNSSHEDIVIIKPGKNFTNKKLNDFIINPTLLEHYFLAFEKIISKKINNYIILHFWSTDQEKFSIHENLLFTPLLYQGFYSGIFITQALSRFESQPNIFCTIVTSQVHAVLGNESINPLKSSILSLCRVLPLEHPNMQFNHIDIEPSDITDHRQLYAKNIIGLALKKAFTNKEQTFETYAFRKSYRWMINYQEIKNLEKPSMPQITIKPDSVYLITGGLGGMGLTFADWLSKQEPFITLVLISRTSFPKKSEWENCQEKSNSENIIHQKIQLLKKITARGTRIVIKTGDVSDYSVMKKIIVNAEKEYGFLKGVLHLAGVPGKGLTALKKLEDISSILLPKIQGTWVLARLLHQKKLDFVVCASSLTAIVGGIGQIDYCAANIFLDSFMSLKPFKKCHKHLTINWNAWASVGMAANLRDSKIHSRFYEENNLSPEQGVSVLENLLCSDYTQMIVSRFSPVEEVKRIINTFKTEGLSDKELISNSHFTYLSKTGIYENIIECWKAILGVNVIHENDNFYALGGDSLLAIQLIMMLQKRFNINFSLQDLMHAPTLGSMAQLIEYRPVLSERSIISLSDHNLQHTQKTVYFIHPLGGTVLCYFPLVPHLRNNFSYYAIQDPGLMKGEMMFNSIQEMAIYYANEICQQQNNEAIVLIGYSFGGNVAIEVAAQLEKKSVLVQNIILVDSWTGLGETTEQYPLSSDASEGLESIKVIRKYYGVNSKQYRLVQARLTWLRSYIPTQIEIPITLLKAKEILPHYESMNSKSKSNGWELYFKRLLTVYEIAGNHDTALRAKDLEKLCILLNDLLELP